MRLVLFFFWKIKTQKILIYISFIYYLIKKNKKKKMTSVDNFVLGVLRF